MEDPKERPVSDEKGGLTPRSTGAERQEEFQRAREQDAPAGEVDPNNNLGRGTPGDREDRIRHRAHEKERGALTDSHLERAAHDIDREDPDILREGMAGEKLGIRTGPEPIRNKPCAE
jgi:hypothetical protein